VGILGISYDGSLPLMALVNPHPALKVAVPMNPWSMAGWATTGSTTALSANRTCLHLRAGGTRDNDANAKWWTSTLRRLRRIHERGFGRRTGPRAWPRTDGLLESKILDHPAYDSFWSDQAVDKVLADDFKREGIKVPIMLVHSLWDQEDIYGAPAVYKAIKPLDTNNDKVFLVLGPWHHGRRSRTPHLSARSVLAPTPGPGSAKMFCGLFSITTSKTMPRLTTSRPVTVYETGMNRWQNLQAWPVAPANEAALS
jgi:predicted acyl esterase